MTESIVIVIEGKPTRVSKDWVWQNCDGKGGTKTVVDFPLYSVTELSKEEESTSSTPEVIQ